MANNNIKIIVVDGGKDYNYKNKAADTEDNGGKKEKDYNPFAVKKNLQNYIKTKYKLGPVGYLALQQGLAAVKQVVGSAAHYIHSGIGLSSGDSNYQDIVNTTVQAHQDVLSFGEGLLSSAAIGSMVGAGAGAAIGIGVSAIVSIVDFAFKTADVKRNFDFQMWKDGVSQSYGLARANYSIYTGRKV